MSASSTLQRLATITSPTVLKGLQVVRDLGAEEVLAGVIGLHNGIDQVLGHVPVVRQQLLGVLGQAIATCYLASQTSEII